MRPAAQAERRPRVPGPRGLELRRRRVAADGVEALDVDLRHPAHDPGIVRDVLQADFHGAIDAEVRRIRVVVAARRPESDVPDKGRGDRPGGAERQPLRSIVVRSEGVVERALRQPEQRRRTERQGIDEAVAAEDREVRRDLVVDADVELILARIGDGRRRVDRLPTRARVRVRDERDDGGADRVPALWRDHPLALRVLAEGRAPGRERIDDHGAEQARLFRGRRHQADARDALVIAQPLVVAEPERAVLDERAADRRAELVALPLRFRRAERVREEVGRIQPVVAQELVDAPPHHVGAGLDRGVDDRAGAAPVLGRIRVRLNLEFLQRFDRRLHELDVLAAKRIRVGDVVDAVEQEDVVEGAVAVDVQHPLEVDAGQPRRAGQHAGRQQGELVVVAAIQRQLDDLLLVDHQAARGGVGVEERRGADHFDRLAERAGLERDVDPRDLRDLQGDAGPDDFREPGAFGGHGILTGPKAGDDIEAGVVGFGLDADVRPDVGHGDRGPGHQRTGGIADGAVHRRGFLLGEHGERERADRNQEHQERKPQTCSHGLPPKHAASSWVGNSRPRDRRRPSRARSQRGYELTVNCRRRP